MGELLEIQGAIQKDVPRRGFKGSLEGSLRLPTRASGFRVGFGDAFLSICLCVCVSLFLLYLGGIAMICRRCLLAAPSHQSNVTFTLLSLVSQGSKGGMKVGGRIPK